MFRIWVRLKVRDPNPKLQKSILILNIACENITGRSSFNGIPSCCRRLTPAPLSQLTIRDNSSIRPSPSSQVGGVSLTRISLRFLGGTLLIFRLLVRSSYSPEIKEPLVRLVLLDPARYLFMCIFFNWEKCAPYCAGHNFLYIRG